LFLHNVSPQPRKDEGNQRTKPAPATAPTSATANPTNPPGLVSATAPPVLPEVVLVVVGEGEGAVGDVLAVFVFVFAPVFVAELVGVVLVPPGVLIAEGEVPVSVPPEVAEGVEESVAEPDPAEREAHS